MLKKVIGCDELGVRMCCPKAMDLNGIFVIVWTGCCCSTDPPSRWMKGLYNEPVISAMML